MKLAIVGSRNYAHLNEVERYVSNLPKDTIIISGGAAGVDMEAVNVARKVGLNYKTILPQWDKYGKVAGLRRNLLIIAEADEVIAFWDGKSRGTKHSIDIAKMSHIPVKIYDE